jgi:membrane protein YqaA with SNARE-associated domain
VRPTVSSTPHPRRYWRSFFVGLAALAAIGGVATLIAPKLLGLFVLGLYCIPTNSVFPLPHEPGILYFAKFYDPIWIALVATAASTITSFADYAMVGAAMKHPRLAGVQGSRLFRWAVKWMKRWPFAIVVLFSLTPLPITVIRILAPASGYPIARYIVAQAVGRLPRFALLAWLGHELQVPTWVLIAMFVVLLGLFWLSGRSREPEPDDDADEATEPDPAVVS